MKKIIISMVLLILISSLFMGCTESHTAEDYDIVENAGYDPKLREQYYDLVDKATLLSDKTETLTNLYTSDSITYDEYKYRYLDACEEYVDVIDEILFFIKYNEEQLENSGMDTQNFINIYTENKHKTEKIVLKLRNN